MTRDDVAELVNFIDALGLRNLRSAPSMSECVVAWGPLFDSDVTLVDARQAVLDLARARDGQFGRRRHDMATDVAWRARSVATRRIDEEEAARGRTTRLTVVETWGPVPWDGVPTASGGDYTVTSGTFKTDDGGTVEVD